jgi:hypothetical protein
VRASYAERCEQEGRCVAPFALFQSPWACGNPLPGRPMWCERPRKGPLCFMRAMRWAPLKAATTSVANTNRRPHWGAGLFKQECALMRLASNATRVEKREEPSARAVSLAWAALAGALNIRILLTIGKPAWIA